MKEDLIRELKAIGGRPARGNMWHCPFHKDSTASAWIKESKKGWYFKCFTCNIWKDVYDLEAARRGVDVRDVLREHKAGPIRVEQFKSLDDIINSLDAVAIEEINQYTNPDNGQIDLVTIRYLKRGERKKHFSQAYPNGNVWINSRPSGKLPLFNRKRVKDDSTIIFVEGEKVVRYLTKYGYTATTGSGGASNAAAQDYSPLEGKTVYLWPDNDTPGINYMRSVMEYLRQLKDPPRIFWIEPTEVEAGGDAADIIDNILHHEGTEDDITLCIGNILSEAEEDRIMGELENLLDDMREGRNSNLPIKDFPLLTRECCTFQNQQISVVYGNAGFGKTLWAGKTMDDLKLAGYDVVRLQLEDQLPKHLLRTFAQQLGRPELTKANFHKENPEESKFLYEENKKMLETIASTIVADENKTWDVASILAWIETQLERGREVVMVDPVSVVLTGEVWLASHRLMWGIKKILRNYPQGRVLLVTHPNAAGDVSGGQSYKRFCHNLLVLTRYPQPKEFVVVDIYGEQKTVEATASIGIVKTRDGSGSGREIAVRLNPETLCIEELGIIYQELKK